MTDGGEWDEPMLDGIDFPEPSKRGRGGEGQRVARKAEPKKGVVWSRVTGVKKPKCSECVRLMEAGGAWRAPDPVVWQRSDGGVETFWCYHHGADPRAKDGLAAKPRL